MIFTEKRDENETKEQRRERMEKECRARTERMSAEDRAIDAAVKRSIEVHGA